MKAIRSGLAALLCLLLLFAVLPAALATEETVEPIDEEKIIEPVEAEDRVPAFVAYDLEQYLKELSTGETFEYRTCGYNGKALPDKKAKAEVTARWAVFYAKDTEKADRDMSNVYVPDGVEPRYVSFNKARMEAAAALEALAGEGYEWRGVEVKVKFTSRSNGYWAFPCMEDYYDIILHDDSSEELDSREKDRSYWSTDRYLIRMNGKELPAYRLYCSKGDGKGTMTYDCFHYVPKGYDGSVFGLLDRRQAPDGWLEGTYVFDYVSKYCLLFRLK